MSFGDLEYAGMILGNEMSYGLYSQLPNYRTPPFSGQIPLHRQNHGQNLTQNFLNSGHSD